MTIQGTELETHCPLDATIIAQLLWSDRQNERSQTLQNNNSWYFNFKYAKICKFVYLTFYANICKFGGTREMLNKNL